MLEKTALENISQGKAFVKTKEGLLGVNPHDYVALNVVLNDINALLATNIWALSDGSKKAAVVEEKEENVEEKTEEKEEKTEEIVEEKIEEKEEIIEEKTEETVEEKPKKKSMAPKCAKKINKPALD
jgi:outer membrane biosynthesis protein TonB